MKTKGPQQLFNSCTLSNWPTASTSAFDRECVGCLSDGHGAARDSPMTISILCPFQCPISPHSSCSTPGSPHGRRPAYKLNHRGSPRLRRWSPATEWCWTTQRATINQNSSAGNCTRHSVSHLPQKVNCDTCFEGHLQCRCFRFEVRSFPALFSTLEQVFIRRDNGEACRRKAKRRCICRSEYISVVLTMILVIFG